MSMRLFFASRGGTRCLSTLIWAEKTSSTSLKPCAAVSKKYVDNMPFLKFAGRQMKGDLIMNNNTVVNLKDPVNLGDGVNQKYSDAAHLTVSSHQSNPLKYLMADIDDSSSQNNIVAFHVSRFDNSPHPNNKNGYRFSLTKDRNGSNQYRSRIGFNVYLLPLGYYTFVA